MVGEQEQVSERVFLQLLPQFRDDGLIVEGVDQLGLLLLRAETTAHHLFTRWVSNLHEDVVTLVSLQDIDLSKETAARYFCKAAEATRALGGGCGVR
ncbi:hypothetical protein EYF80_025784 [Liparis tanakae]|uniref:Uncharacterized protein n=1 Tax=Liparis tanakae TaxID=230148 RepID=A0A4Z2HEL5_9TELE|nr:hypothetical protein EYF80_025784 [Liparis tanakae]